MAKPVICLIVLPDTGAICGYEAQGETMKAKIEDLLRHQDKATHPLPKAHVDSLAMVTFASNQL